MSIITGTDDTQTEHSQAAGVLGILAAIAIPALLATIGISAYGWEAISWFGVIVWGVVAALAMSGFVAVGRAIRMTRMDISRLLGSIFAEPGTSEARFAGMGVHLMMGVLLAAAWAYTMLVFGWPTSWFSGLLWGAFVSLLALLVFSSIGVIHPRIRRGDEEDPGPGGTNLGKMTPVGVIAGHLVYGIVLGGLYQVAPLG